MRARAYRRDRAHRDSDPPPRPRLHPGPARGDAGTSQRIIARRRHLLALPGWLRYSQTSFIQNREKRFKEYEERFGTDSAAYLIELEGSWLRNYTNACLILWEGWEDERELVRTAKAVADDAGLGYRELPGDPNFIQALLEAGKDGRFLRIAPGFTPDLDGNGTITAVRVTS